MEITYDAWGNFTDTISDLPYPPSTEQLQALEIPFRYRGYYYDQDTGFYYLNSRYYDAKVCRFINADDISYLGANDDMSAFNLYAYCSNNPVMYSDPSGNFFITASVAATYAAYFLIAALAVVILCDPVVQESIADATEAVADAVDNTVDFIVESIDNIQDELKSEPIVDTKSNDNRARFTVNPYDFNPKGLVRREYPGTKNGRIIKWENPTTKIAVFEWNEDFNNGSHYHILENGKHTGDHWFPNQIVPEPWNSIYFGG